MKKLVLFLIFPVFGISQITFTKDANTDASLEVNQDRISNNVWLTRGVGGGLFNAFVEDSYTRGTSPSYTEWAIGTTAQISNGAQLSFSNFRDFYTEVRDGFKIHNRPPLNTDLVLKLTNNTTDTSDDVYYDLKFTNWYSGQNGSFSYTRSSTPLLSLENYQNIAVSIYPNPTTSIVTVDGNSVYDIEVFDLLGNKVIKQKGNIIDMQHLATAMYIVKATDKINNVVFVYRVIKE